MKSAPEGLPHRLSQATKGKQASSAETLRAATGLVFKKGLVAALVDEGRQPERGASTLAALLLA
jgi:hypothetical protein